MKSINLPDALSALIMDPFENPEVVLHPTAIPLAAKQHQTTPFNLWESR